MTGLSHKIIQTEVKYGILSLRKKDGTDAFFSELPESFTIIFRGDTLYSRSVLTNKVWLGVKEQLVPNCKHPKKMRDRSPDDQWYCMACNLDL